MELDLDDLVKVDDASEHVFNLYIEKTVDNQDLGYVDRRQNAITINFPLCNIELTINQSLSQLSSRQETSSTGFVCWKTSQLLVEWLLWDSCPYHKYFKLKNLTVVELGAGVGGICALMLGPLTKRYICTDQKHILKLLKENISNNIDNFKSSTIDNGNNGNTELDVIEFDWEQTDEGMYNYHQLTQDLPDLIIACDTIYNEYLIPYFLDALKALMNHNTIALVGVQLRDDHTLETFINKTKERFDIYLIPDELLTQDLKVGFVMYFIKVMSSK